ncbi:hypothetical protein BEH93_31640 [Streptomyces sp. 2R]|nr:hypothetical protein BEH93_31640 [Streptomyces sp. 2R]
MYSGQLRQPARRRPLGHRPQRPHPDPFWQARTSPKAVRPSSPAATAPIGTFLRAHSATGTRLLVAYPGAVTYKIEEIRDDARVRLLPVAQLTPHSSDGSR